MPLSTLLSALTALVSEKSWCGTATELGAALAANGVLSVMKPAPLSHLLRQGEPELYWRGIRIRFCRKVGTGIRLIEIIRSAGTAPTISRQL